MPAIQDLREKLVEAKASAETLTKRAEAENRSLSDDEATTLQNLLADFNAAEAELKLLEQVQGLEARAAAPTGRKTEPADTQTVDDSNLTRRPAQAALSRPNVIRHRGTWDWEYFGQYAAAVAQAGQPGGSMDPRLTAHMAPTTYGTETVGADGGFAVPPDFRAEIQQLISAEESLLGRCDKLVSSSNHFTAPKDMTTPWQTSGGILPYWEGEVSAATQSKPALKSETVPLDKLFCLVPVSDELMEDAPALDAYLRRKVPEKMSFKVDLAIVQGTGVGQPNGILTSGSLVTQDKESGQSADTVVMENIINMWTHLYAPCRPRSVWLINQDIEAQLMLMEFTGTNATVPAYLPANGLAGTPYGTLLGRPVLPTQACETLGDLGDIILCDLSQYMIVQKSTGIRNDVSIHLWFDYDTTAYRFIWRIGGRPWWDATITSRDNSSFEMSPFVTLQARA